MNNNEPCSPFFITVNCGPHDIIILAHLIRLAVLHNNLASSSLITTPLTLLIILITSSRLFRIQYSIVSQTVNLGFGNNSSNLMFWIGSLLARYIYCDFLYSFGIV